MMEPDAERIDDADRPDGQHDGQHGNQHGEDLPDHDVSRWVEAVTGRHVIRVEREHAGGSRPLWYLRLDGSPTGAAVGREVVLRLDTGGGALGNSPYTLDREALVYSALAASTPPLPRLIATRPGALLLERIPGRSRLDHLDDADAGVLLTQFIDAVASLHRVDPATLGTVGLTPPPTTLAAVEDELATWRALAAGVEPPDPLVEYALAWLTESAGRLSRASEPPVFVQGDTGPGNFVADGSTLSGLVDWELSHFGDPMDDLAWIDMRCAAMSGPFGDAARRDGLYEDASTFAVDDASLAFHAVFVRLRCTIITARTLGSGGGALGLVAYAPPHHRFREELALALLAALDLEPPPEAEIDALPSAMADLDDDAIAGLREIVLPAAPTPGVKLRVRAALLALEHHSALERLGPTLRQMEDDDRRATLGRVIDDGDLAVLAARAGSVSDGQILGLLHRSARRARVCWDVPTARTGPAIAPLRRTARTTSHSRTTEQVSHHG